MPPLVTRATAIIWFGAARSRFGASSARTYLEQRKARLETAAGFLLSMVENQSARRFRGVSTGRPRVTDTIDRKSTTSELQSLMRKSYAVFCLKTNIINLTVLSVTPP